MVKAAGLVMKRAGLAKPTGVLKNMAMLPRRMVCMVRRMVGCGNLARVMLNSPLVVGFGMQAKVY